MSKWEENFGREYRAEHKRTHYDIVNVQFLKDGSDGLTKADAVKAAEGKGMTLSGYIKSLIRADIEKEQEK